MTKTWALLTDHFDEGGTKQSGIGRLRGPHAIEEFQEMKTYAQTEPPLC
jgi:betaine-aldehyde dehydrogenase